MPVASSTLFDSVESTSDLELGIHPLSPVSISVTKTPSPKQADSSMAAALQEASPPSNYLTCHSPILNLSPNMSPESQAASASPVFDLLENARTRNVHELYGSLSSITQDLVNLKQEEDVKNEPPKKRRRVIQADDASGSAGNRHTSRPRSHRRRSGASNHTGSSANHRTDTNASSNRNVVNPSSVQQSTIQDFLPAQILSERLTNQQPVEDSRPNQMSADSQLTNHHPAHLPHHMVRGRVHPERCVHPNLRPSHLADAGMTLAPQPAHLPFYPVMSLASQAGYIERNGHAITRHSNRSHSQQVPTDLSSRRPDPRMNQHNTQNPTSFYRHPHIHTAAPPQQYISAVPLNHRAVIGRVPTSHVSSARSRGTQPHMSSNIPVNNVNAHPYSRINHMSQFTSRHGNPIHRPYFAAPGGMIPGAAHTHLAGVGPSGQPYPTSFLLQLWAMFNPGTAGPYRMEMPDEMGEIENYEALLNLAERLSEAKPKGLNKPEIEKLFHYVFNPNLKRDSTKDQTTCVVCMCDFENGEKLRVLPCSHEFHMKCVDKWLKSNRTCPICRSDASKPAN